MNTSPPEPPQRVRLDRLSVTALQLLLIGAVGWGLLQVWSHVSLVLLPFAIALLLAALLSPISRFLHERVRIPAAPAAILTVLLLLAVIAGVLTWVLPAIATQGTELVRQLQSGVQEIPSLLHSLGLNDAEVQRYTHEATAKLQDSLGGIGRTLTGGLLIAASSLVDLLITVVLAVIMLVYLLVDGAGFWRGVLRFAPAGRRESWQHGGARSWRASTAFIHAQVIVATGDGVFIGLGLLLLGVPLALPIGVLTFLFAFVPYLGAIVAGVVAMLVALSVHGLAGMLATLVLVIIVHQIEGNILYPLLVGRSLRLHPLTVVLSVGAGGALAGIPGTFLATPIVAAVAAALGWVGVEEDAHAVEAGVEPDAEGGEPPDGEPPPDDGPDGPGDADADERARRGADGMSEPTGATPASAG